MIASFIQILEGILSNLNFYNNSSLIGEVSDVLISTENSTDINFTCNYRDPRLTTNSITNDIPNNPRSSSNSLNDIC